VLEKNFWDELKEEWLIAESVSGKRQFLVHTLVPRFIGEIIDNDEGGNDIVNPHFIDAPPVDAAYLARLMREGGEALAEYDRILEEGKRRGFEDEYDVDLD